jgi:hypothetical protein
MKYVILTLAITILSSCSAILSPIIEKIEDEIFIDYPYLEEDLDIAWKKVSKFQYNNDPSGIGYWKSPKEFEKDGFGDCEDFSAYMIYHLGKEASCVMVHLKKHPYNLNHAIVFYKGRYIEPQKYGKYYAETDFDIIKNIHIGNIYLSKAVISYDLTMKLCTNFFTK